MSENQLTATGSQRSRVEVNRWGTSRSGQPGLPCAIRSPSSSPARSRGLRQRQPGVGPMYPYYVYIDKAARRVIVHRAECRACMHGEGRHGPKIAFRRGRTHVWVGAGGGKEGPCLRP
jgi:hypothetical protein